MDNNMNVQNNLAPQYMPEAPKEKKIKEKKSGNGSKILIGIVGGVVAAMVLIAVIAIMMATAPKTIDLSDYVTCTFEGYDHLGEADVVIDFVGVAKEYQKELGVKTPAELSSALVTMNECITVKVESYTNLTNKQEFVVKFDIDNKLMKDRYNCVLKCKEVRTVVSKLTELTDINPFDYMEIGYSGTNEYSADASINYTGEYGDSLRGCINLLNSSWSDVHNGQEIVVTIDKDLEWFAYKGFYPTVLEKTYVVDGLDTHYGIKISDIDTEDINNNLKEVKTKLMSEREEIVDVIYKGAMLVEAKEKNSRTSNGLSLIYEVKMSDESGSWSYYYSSTYSNIIKEYNGGVSLEDMKYSNPEATKGWFTIYGTGFEKDGKLYAGYQTLEEINNDIDNDDYTIVDNIIK